jgi:hypothetical protein
MILYDQLPAGQRAMGLFTRLVAEFGRYFEFQPFIWRFDLVRAPGWQELIDKEISITDLLIISMTSQCGLPGNIRAWLNTYLPRIQKNGLVVCLAEDDLRKSEPSEVEFLQNLAAESGLDFLSSHSSCSALCSKPRNIIPLWLSTDKHAPCKIPVRPGVILGLFGTLN